MTDFKPFRRHDNTHLSKIKRPHRGSSSIDIKLTYHICHPKSCNFLQKGREFSRLSYKKGFIDTHMSWIWINSFRFTKFIAAILMIIFFQGLLNNASDFPSTHNIVLDYSTIAAIIGWCPPIFHKANNFSTNHS